MSRIGVLLAKELREHGLAMGALLVLLGGVATLLLIGAALAPRTLTLLETHATFVRFFLPIVGLALGHRLIVREYQAGTQRLLEALPLRRWEVMLAKLLFGLAVLGLAALASLVISAGAAAFREPVTLTWLALIALRTALFTFTLGAFFLTMGLLGRFRIPVYLTLLFATLFLAFATDLELRRFGPFALIGERFVLEREDFPWREAAVTLAMGLGMLGVGALIALSREGALAEGLARRMSAREKGTVGIILIGALIGSELVDARTKKKPFAFEHEAVVRAEGIDVLHLEARHRAAAEALSAVVAEDLRGVREALGRDDLPPVHVALRAAVDPREIERVTLKDEEGVLLRASFASEGFDRDALRAAVLERVLASITRGRAAFEPYVWVQRGFARAWVHRGETLPAPALLALWAARQERPSTSLLAEWERTEERFGVAAADGLAYVAARAIETQVGEDAWQRFARTLLAEPPPLGVLAVIDLRLDPIEARLERETGLTPRALDEALDAQLTAWRALERGPLARVPRTDAFILVEPGNPPALRWWVDADRPFEPGATCTLVHAAIGPFDAPLDPDALFREERPCAELDDEEARLVGRYGSGERVFAAIELDTPALGAPVRVVATRLEIP